MPARTGKCINFGGCNKADSQELVTIPDGSEFVCPDCERSLVATGGRGGKSGGGGSSTGKAKLLIPAVLGLGLIVGLIAWLVWPNPPDITSFSVEPAQIDSGQMATLKWTVQHATDMSIDHALGPVQPEDSLPVSPRGTTTYTLTAKKGNNVVTKSVTLQVNGGGTPPPTPVSGPPIIDSFTANPTVVQVGETTVLQWSTRNTTSVSLPNLNPPANNLAPVGNMSVTPHLPGIINIVIVGVGQRNSVRREVTIRVMKAGGSERSSQRGRGGAGRLNTYTPPNVPPNSGNRAGGSLPVISLQAYPQSIAPGATASLRWSVNGATEVEIYPGLGRVGMSGTLQVSPQATSTYTLRASGPGGSTQQSVIIQVQPGQQGQQGPQGPTEPPEPSGPTTPASGALIWEGDVQGQQVVTIQNGTASPGQLVSGKLPGRQVVLKPQNVKKVGIKTAPSPDNGYQLLELRVFGHGHTRVEVDWFTP